MIICDIVAELARVELNIHFGLGIIAVIEQNFE